MSMVADKFLAYDVSRLPAGLMRSLRSFTFQIMVLATIYYGGIGLLVYYTFKLPASFAVSIWLMSCLVNAGLLMSFPGLFYFDKTSELSSIVIIIGLGPINFPRALCCYLSFRLNVKTDNLRRHDMLNMPMNSRFTTHLTLLRRSISEWVIDDPWLNAIKRNADIGVPSFWDKLRRKWGLVKRIAGLRVF